jgi:hypothetical protein
VLPITEETLLRLTTTSGVVSVSIVLIRSVTLYLRERQRLQAFLVVTGRPLGDELCLGAVRYVEGQCQISWESPSIAPPPQVPPSHNGRQGERRQRRRQRTDPPPEDGPGP